MVVMYARKFFSFQSETNTKPGNDLESVTTTFKSPRENQKLISYAF